MPARARYRDQAEQAGQREADIRHHIIEVRNADERARVGEKMIGRVLRDRVEEQETDQPREQQREQEPDALAKGEIA
jgi:hypothetical protein